MKDVASKPKITGPYSSVSEGSTKPSPHVLRSVSCSSNGCQRTPTLGTNEFVSLLKASNRLPAANSSEWKNGIFHLGLKMGLSVSPSTAYSLRPTLTGNSCGTLTLSLVRFSSSGFSVKDSRIKTLPKASPTLPPDKSNSSQESRFKCS